MNVYFNELSLSDDVSVNHRCVDGLGRVWAKLKAETKMRHLLCAFNIQEIVRKMGCDKPGIGKQFLYSVLRGPYIDIEEDSHSNEEEERFVSSEFFLLSDSGGKLGKCDSIGWAIIKKSIFIGLPTSNFWTKSEYRVEEAMSPTQSQLHVIGGITSLEHFMADNIKNWIDFNFRDVPVECALATEEKRRKFFPRHHGVKELDEFAEKILKDRYIVEIVNSINHLRHCNKLVAKEYSDGRMDICLYWTNAHYAMCVRTTAVNKFQSEFIRKHLEEEFGSA